MEKINLQSKCRYVPSFVDENGVLRSFSNYLVDLDTSEVISLQFGKVKVLTTNANEIGYHFTSLVDDNGQIFGANLHRIIYATYYQTWDWWLKEGKEIHHKDDDKGNNHWSNLEKRYHFEQYDEACRKRMSIHKVGSRHPLATVNEEQVREIRNQYQIHKRTNEELLVDFVDKMAEMYGTSEGVIYQIIYNNSWKHVQS